MSKMNQDGTKPIIIYPEGSQLPDHHQLNVLRPDLSLVDRIVESREYDVPAMVITNRELQAVVQYPDVFAIDLIVLDHLPGGKYDSVFNSFLTGVHHISAETLAKEVALIRDDPNQGKPSVDKFDTLFDRADKRAEQTVKGKLASNERPRDEEEENDPDQGY